MRHALVAQVLVTRNSKCTRSFPQPPARYKIPVKYQQPQRVHSPRVFHLTLKISVNSSYKRVTELSGHFLIEPSKLLKTIYRTTSAFFSYHDGIIKPCVVAPYCSASGSSPLGPSKLLLPLLSLLAFSTAAGPSSGLSPKDSRGSGLRQDSRVHAIVDRAITALSRALLYVSTASLLLSSPSYYFTIPFLVNWALLSE